MKRLGDGNPCPWGTNSWKEWEKAAGRLPERSLSEERKKQYFEETKRSNFEASSRLEDK
ncbi:hypothetical protein SXHG_00013 [Synechococcus phage MRHenn-2013a]|nr:hypothetical protein SXHG_00013 [Synechococcus phage MRHenn-2013a]